MMGATTKQDRLYLDLLLKKIRVCKVYKPKFGQGKAVSLAQFHKLYGDDPLYSWFGLDNPLLYAAHKAAGGMTSLYRQIGNGLEIVFRQILRDQLGLSKEQSSWSYKVHVEGKKPRKLTLDGRIVLEDVADPAVRDRVREWMSRATHKMGLNPKVAAALSGVVFEVRQGYKSKDSKRQNADIGNAATALAQGYLPVAVILSTQIDSDVAERYIANQWLLLRGYETDDALESTYAFCREILGYDLSGLLETNSGKLKETVNEVLQALLRPTEEEGEPDLDTADLEKIDETDCVSESDEDDDELE